MLESQIQIQYTVFPNKEKFECLTPEVYVYHNFLSKEECEQYIDLVNSSGLENRMYDVESLSVLTERLKSALIVKNDSILGVNTGFRVDPFTQIKKFTSGDGMLPHNDVYGWKSRLFEGLSSDTNKDNVVFYPHSAWSTLIYFNDDYEGGEIEYLDNNLICKPIAGDLIMHAVEAIHGVRKVISGTRYSSQSNINQNYCFDKSFIDNFRWPINTTPEEALQGKKQSQEIEHDPDWQYSIYAEYITNPRLRKYTESNDINWDLYGTNKESFLKQNR